jgi:hypothetical protein
MAGPAPESIAFGAGERSGAGADSDSFTPLYSLIAPLIQRTAGKRRDRPSGAEGRRRMSSSPDTTRRGVRRRTARGRSPLPPALWCESGYSRASSKVSTSQSRFGATSSGSPAAGTFSLVRRAVSLRPGAARAWSAPVGRTLVPSSSRTPALRTWRSDA